MFRLFLSGRGRRRLVVITQILAEDLAAQMKAPSRRLSRLSHRMGLTWTVMLISRRPKQRASCWRQMNTCRSKRKGLLLATPGTCTQDGG